MINSIRNRARTGGVACPCCACPAPSRTIRTREKRQWKKDFKIN